MHTNRGTNMIRSNLKLMPPYKNLKKDSDKKDAPVAYAEDVDQLAD